MVSGLYGALGIRSVGEEALVAAYGIPRKGGTGWTVPVHVEWDRHDAPPGARELPSGFPDTPVQVELTGPDGAAVQTIAVEAGSGNARLVRPGELVVDIPVTDPELWWPAGYGKQPRYTITVRFGGETRSFSTAFRTVEVVSEKDDTGRSMFFRVNGRDIWAKGANWIPVDAFPSRHTPERSRNLLLDVVDANMNMIRVWGGGQYEDDAFYDTCDELGILVWQDFMFSCSLYPSESWFLAEVREEVRAQLRRLVSHPSVALWCGNNENIGALGWFDVSTANPGRYLIDFDRLNHGVIATEVRAFDDTRVFWPSSPAAGEGDFSDNWHDDSAGDMHYWSVWHEGKPFHAYYDVTPRFCSEFGFQSFPGLVTLGQFAPPEQFNPTAPDMEHHQRNPRGNTVILETMSRYFRVPFTFADFVYLSQVQQAMAIGMAVEYWRSRRPVSMGALYWQLNDLWPVVSWSSIEYDGRWKLLHYAARRFFAPLRVVLIHRDGRISAHLLNDTVEPVSGVLRIRGIDWSGTEVWRHEEPLNAAPESGTELWVAVVGELPFEPAAAFLLAEVLSPDGAVLDRHERVLVPYKTAPLEVPSISVTPSGPRSITLTCADAPAFWVTLGTEDERFQPEDNGFFMLPGERREIALQPIRGLASGGFAGTSGPQETPAAPSTLNVTVRTIRDTY
jgi:beta-mannosidase